MKDMLELQRKIIAFGDNAIEGLEQAQIETAKAICNDVQEMAPVDTGRYRDSIHVEDTFYDGERITTEISTNYRVGMYEKVLLAPLLEYGTKPHIIKPRYAQALHFVNREGEEVFTRLVHHPGFNAIPHWHPALTNNEELYKQNIYKHLFNLWRDK